MLDEFLEKYIHTLYERQNFQVTSEQKGLYTKKDYYSILKPVINLIQKKGILSLDEMRTYLFEQSMIDKKLEDFIYKREAAPGMVLSYGTFHYQETIVIGNKQEVKLDQRGNIIDAREKMTKDTIFDLASVTKIFMSLSLLKLVQIGSINLSDEIIKYAPQFKNLSGITIFDLMTFKVPLKTKTRMDKALSKEEAERLLFHIEIDKESDHKRPYTDMGVMILRYIVEHVSGMDYYNFIKENILSKVGMKDTYVVVPKTKINRIANTFFDGKYYDRDYFVINKNMPIGAVYDSKARIMGQQIGILSGHAGLFSTVDDMTHLARGIINGEIINEKYIEMMSQNQTGKRYIENGKEKYIQYLGMLCYCKNPNLESSALFHAMSGNAFASSGWTGTHLTVDPLNQIYFFMASNRSHNRMTFIDVSQRSKVKTDFYGKRICSLPDGNIKIDATNFAWDRGPAVVHPILKLTIQYKMLEDLYLFLDEKIEKNEKVKQILPINSSIYK